MYLPFKINFVKPVHSAFLLFIIFQSCAPENESGSADTTSSLDIKVDSLLSLMTLEEKVHMIHASSPFTSGGVERLGIPELILSDGPHGVRHEHGRDWVKDDNVYDSSTYLPVGTALGATWNPALGYKFGQVLGSEANFRGKDVILGPGLNIIRSPLNGRNFEYLTEDPYLNSKMVVGYIKGVQENDVATSAKHYIANSLEYDREYVNVEMSDRALREIYLPGFKAAVQEGGAYTVMAAYNKFRGTYCAHSKYLLDNILKDEFGFEGLVMSDWAAVKSPDAISVGMDIEMGTDLLQGSNVDYNKFHMADTAISLVKSGAIDESIIDAKVRRILTVMYKIKKFGGRKKGEYNTAEHQAIAREIADEAIVLLKNENILPLNQEAVKKVTVVGANANHKHAGAGGSSQLKAYYEVTPLAGLKNLLGVGVEITYAKGYEIAKGEPDNAAMIAEAVAAVKEADVAIYVGGWVHGYTDEWNDNAYDAEVVDKPSMMLPFGQEELISAVLEANPNTIMVMVGGGPIDMRTWQNDAKSIVQAWYAGMEGGNALADILFGNVNPSGKLPFTFPAKLEDSPAHSLAKYPDENLLIDHKEDIFVGYRYFDTYEVEPAFAFGHGMSYTSFEYSDLTISKDGSLVRVSLKVTNSGDRAGAEVVQVYVHDQESSLKRPIQELKGFEKVLLKANETTEVAFTLDEDAFSFYDDQTQRWTLEPGRFTINVGSSSRDIRLKEEIEL